MGVEYRCFVFLFATFCLTKSTDTDNKFQVQIDRGILMSVQTDEKLLNLSHFELTDISPEAFDRVTHITSLELTVNKLVTLKENTFSKLTELQHLTIKNLGNPDHTDMNLFYHQKKLKVLDLSQVSSFVTEHVEIVGLPDDCEFRVEVGCTYSAAKEFGFNESLQIGNQDLAKFNCYEEFPELLNNVREDRVMAEMVLGVSDPTGLFTACVSNGTVQLIVDGSESIDGDNCSFINFTDSKSINLSRKGIKSFVENWCKVAENSSVLFLHENEIEEINENILNHLPQTIKIVSLLSNEIRVLRNNAMANGNIQQLDFKSNNIETIESDAFRGTISLVDLNLSFNNISDLNFATSLSNTLLQLDLMGNNIALIPNNIFSHLSDLAILQLSFNKIKAISGTPFAGLKRVYQLSVLENPIGEIKNGPYDDLLCLESLYFYANATVTNIEKGFAKNMNNLKILYFNENLNVTKFERGLFYGLPYDSMVYYPDNLTSIAIGAFRNSTN